MDGIEVLKFEFRKGDLTRIPARRLAFILAAAHAANELNVLRTMMAFEARDDFGSDFVKAHTTIRWMTLARTSLGKVFEFRNLVNSYSSHLKKEGADAWDQFQIFLKKHSFGKIPPWVGELRNNVTFHYEVDYLGKQLDLFADEAVSHSLRRGMLAAPPFCLLKRSFPNRFLKG